MERSSFYSERKRKEWKIRMKTKVNEKEISFIMCTNNQKYMEEALYYITHLNVPKGYEISFLTIEDAKSMAGGYNEGMNASNAKYKVYIHQDTFIVYQNFLVDTIRLFEENPRIGMLGMIGISKMPESGIMWDGKQVGGIYESHIYETIIRGNSIPENQKYAKVEAIDGLLMMTQYDITWREDMFDKWDFYDASQSMEFIKKGYEVVVPAMDRPWVLHDCGVLNKDHYEEERLKFLKEYME